MRRSSGSLATILLSGALLWGSAAPALAADPPESIPLGSEPASCSNETSAACEEWTVGRLNAGRAKLGLKPYALPAGFIAMPSDRQLFILVDLDRVAYADATVYGLNTNLTEAAQAGVAQGKDPRPPSAGGPWQGFGSDWASTGPLIGYYLWMYDDGYGGPNADCTSPGASGCWGHRHVILGEGLSIPQPQLLGAAGEANRGSALIVSSNGTTSSYYTWAQAQSEGAGSESKGKEESKGEEGVPSVTSISPRSGPAAGGTDVTITGNDLGAVKSVRFGSVAAAGFTITSTSSIVAVAPAGAAGEVAVTVTDAAGTSAAGPHDSFKYEPVVTGLSPASGTTKGGTRVTISGAGFLAGSSETTIEFGSAAATQVSCASSTECSAVAPAHAAGKVAVKVKVNGTTSASGPADRYTYS